MIKKKKKIKRITTKDVIRGKIMFNFSNTLRLTLARDQTI
jgi:hypothetical protein